MTNYVADTNITHEEWVVMMERWPQALNEMRESWDSYDNDLDLLEEHTSQLDWLSEMLGASAKAIIIVHNPKLTWRYIKALCKVPIPLARLYFKVNSL